MFIGIIIGIAVICSVLSFFSEKLKKVLEIISFIARLCVGGAVSMMVYQALSIEFQSTWSQLAFVGIGAIIVVSVIMGLSAVFRLVGYSINYFINSIIVLIIASMLGDSVTISFAAYALVLFLFPRIMWISDRHSTSTEYSHTEHSFDVDTRVYVKKDVDWWENSEGSWSCIPLQIVIASIFYAIGSITITSTCPIESGWMTALYIILATAINVIFDLFVFRIIDDFI